MAVRSEQQGVGFTIPSTYRAAVVRAFREPRAIEQVAGRVAARVVFEL